MSETNDEKAAPRGASGRKPSSETISLLIRLLMVVVTIINLLRDR
ncbi:hypothetical protein [Kutzneria chonburiensis]|uniref:Uncharacterized protein n=1 Tax=Kutzneria chonburiensis TaxID=1483604 RepID=A0ABV6MNM8_9PSEU|nr:hypothetical protein [Kutzneria chonburiensis]